MTARLAAGIWVAAYLRRLGILGIPAYIVARGDATAGAVLVKLSLMDGTARLFQRAYDMGANARVWEVLAEGDERAMDAVVARQRSFDPDLWVIEVEDAKGRHLLDQDGLE